MILTELHGVMFYLKYPKCFMSPFTEIEKNRKKDMYRCLVTLAGKSVLIYLRVDITFSPSMVFVWLT